MRPIERGAAPRAYTDYRDAIGDLEERLGTYCSFCEMRVPSGLAVEHMAPKKHFPERKLNWGNFLLGCVICNSIKGDKDVADDEVFWPDRNNTMLVLAYSPGGYVEAVQNLDPDLKRRAQVLIDLVGLDRHGAEGSPRPSRRDRRWADREEVWTTAEKCRFDFERAGESEEAFALVLVAAKGLGFFSVWLAVFQGHFKVKRALIEGFPGTATSCFNDRGEPEIVRVPRYRQDRSLTRRKFWICSGSTRRDLRGISGYWSSHSTVPSPAIRAPTTATWTSWSGSTSRRTGAAISELRRTWRTCWAGRWTCRRTRSCGRRYVPTSSARPSMSDLNQWEG